MSEKLNYDDFFPAEAMSPESRPAEEDDLAALFADIGMVDPYTGEAIRTKSDFLRWKQRFLDDSAARAAEEQRFAAPDPMALDDSRGDVKLRLDELVNSELGKIRQWDDAVEALADIADSEVYPAIYEKVMKGYSLSDAFYLANADRLQQAAVSRAEEALRSQLMSKDHLRSRSSRGGGDVHIPAEVMAEFQRIVPEADAEAVRKFYKRDRVKTKK